MLKEIYRKSWYKFNIKSAKEINNNKKKLHGKNLITNSIYSNQKYQK